MVVDEICFIIKVTARQILKSQHLCKDKTRGVSFMQNLRISLLAILVLSIAVIGGYPALVSANSPNDNSAAKQLTVEQKQEMANLQKEVLEKKKIIISKYVEYGVFTEDTGNKIISRLDKRYQRLETNGFIPSWDKAKQKRPQGCNIYD